MKKVIVKLLLVVILTINLDISTGGDLGFEVCSCRNCYKLLNFNNTYSNGEICKDVVFPNSSDAIILTLESYFDKLFVQHWLLRLNFTEDILTSAFKDIHSTLWTALTNYTPVDQSWIEIEYDKSQDDGKDKHFVLSHKSNYSKLRPILGSEKYPVICQEKINHTFPINSTIIEFFQFDGTNFTCIDELLPTKKLSTVSPTTTLSTTSTKTLTTTTKISYSSCKDSGLGLICSNLIPGLNVTIVVSDVMTKLENVTLKSDEICEVNDRVKLIEDKFQSEMLQPFPNVNKLADLTRDLINIHSLMIDKKNQKAWKQLNESTRFTQLNSLTRSVQKTAKFIGKYKTFAHSTENINVLVEKKRLQDNNSLYMTNWENLTWDIEVILPNLQNQNHVNNSELIVVCVLYKTLHTLKESSEKKLKEWKISSPVLTLTLSNGDVNINQFQSGNEIVMVLPKFEIDEDKISCGFWNKSKEISGWWDTNGCRPISITKSRVSCSCSHLTSFALLMDLSETPKQDEVEFYLTIICCTISIFCELITIIVFQYFKSLQNLRTTITKNLCFNLSVGTLLVLFASDKTENQILCSIIAGATHFFFLSAFSWMCLEGYHLYLLLVCVFQRRNSHTKQYYMTGYGVPAAIVTISASLHPTGYGTEKYCWLRTDDAFIWTFLGPVSFVIVLNTFFLILAVRSAVSVKTIKDAKRIEKIRKWIRGSFSLSTLLGITWVFGYFNYMDKSKFIAYTFITLNALQGLFILVFHCLLNENVQQTILRHFFHPQKLAWLRHRQSSTTPSKTSLKTMSSDESRGNTRKI